MSCTGQKEELQRMADELEEKDKQIAELREDKNRQIAELRDETLKQIAELREQLLRQAATHYNNWPSNKQRSNCRKPALLQKSRPFPPNERGNETVSENAHVV